MISLVTVSRRTFPQSRLTLDLFQTHIALESCNIVLILFVPTENLRHNHPNMSMSIEDVQGAPREPRPFPDTPENVMQQLSMKGKVVAITGASDGIGWAVAQAMAEAGGHVALLYNSNNAAETKAPELAKQHGITARAYQLEISDPHRVEKVINQIAEDFGRLDVFVANSGAAISKPILEQSIEEYRHLISVNSEC